MKKSRIIYLVGLLVAVGVGWRNLHANAQDQGRRTRRFDFVCSSFSKRACGRSPKAGRHCPLTVGLFKT
jgi:hypothetical protein